jgi:OPT family oligopeptide transporter
MTPTPPPSEAEDPERRWLANVYAGDHTRQLTLRAIVTGMLLGGLMALSNLYVALKTGWSLGVTITAAVLAFLGWSAITKVLRRVTHFGPLENNAMQSVASAAGYMTGGGTVAAIPALMITTGYKFEPLTMIVWIATLAFLGVFVAIPLKRQMVNIEQLRFPTGTASAETVLSLHGQGAESQTKARALGLAALTGIAVAAARDAWHAFPEHVAAFGARAARWGFQLETSVIMLGAGAIMGMRVAMSQLAGAIICYGIAAPWAHEQGAIASPVGYKNIVSWSVWFGASMMLTAGILQFFLGWKAVKRAFADLVRVFRPQAKVGDDPLARIEVPSSWFMRGLAVLGPIVIFLQWYLFSIPPWMGALTVIFSLVIAVVAARSTGETDTTPTGAMGKLVQLTFGVLHPGNMTTNLVTAQATAGVALHASDLLTDLKSGYILGAKPRQQFYAQFFGVIAGSLAVVPAFMILVPDASVIPDKFPAPSAIQWGAVAKLLAEGLASLHWTARLGLALGGGLGIVLTLLERWRPTWKRFIPSPMGFGLAWTFPCWNSVSMAVGALLAFALEKKNPKLAALLVIAVASGLIAGESLAGVSIKLWQEL